MQQLKTKVTYLESQSRRNNLVFVGLKEGLFESSDQSNDYTLFAKILAMCLERVVPSLVHFDQLRFVKGRYALSKMRRLFHIMHRAASLKHPAVMLSLDAEKEFDRIEWPYLFYTLGRYGFGPICMQWIRELNYKPLACVKTNGIVPSSFALTRSARQGCPVSPIIFILALALSS